MSLTSYRAAPPRATICRLPVCLGLRSFGRSRGWVFAIVFPRISPKERAAFAARLPVGGPFCIEKITTSQSDALIQRAFGRPGSDLLSRVLRRSTISAGAFHGRVRNGIGCSRSAITTRSAKRTLFREALSEGALRGMDS